MIIMSMANIVFSSLIIYLFNFVDFHSTVKLRIDRCCMPRDIFNLYLHWRGTNVLHRIQLHKYFSYGTFIYLLFGYLEKKLSWTGNVVENEEILYFCCLEPYKLFVICVINDYLSALECLIITPKRYQLCISAKIYY